LAKRHYAGLINLISKDTGVNAADLIDFDLYFADGNF